MDIQKQKLRDAIYRGDVAATKKGLEAYPDGECCFGIWFGFDDLEKPVKEEGYQEEYTADLVSWVLKADADHPKHFLPYKEILDAVIKKEGVDKVIARWKNPSFGCGVLASKAGVGGFIKMPVPVSRQMKGYLGYLEDTRTTSQHQEKQVVNTKADDPEKIEAQQKVLALYRSRHPHSL